ncbi:recombination protein RecT [Aneurinibacillus thermoaerophilus]|uniref:Recombination protein RecT n=1 Tax=Aneurinibacillus thermoaerophilus TaxID=143495 RepID=A0A1G7XB90_ANETH|nr:recombination protein RecT [Aneurinibacillus thermoaerophilus]
MKTVLKSLLSKWGILSVEMQKAVVEDKDERELKDVTSESHADMIEVEGMTVGGVLI